MLDRVATVTDAENRVTGLTYDALGRVTEIHNTAIQAAALEAYSYTDNGQVTSFTDARGNATSYTYDGFDRAVTTTYPGASTETATYDAVGNILTTTNRAGQTTSMVYDALNRVTTQTPPSPEAVVSYTYDVASRVLSVNDTSAAITAVANPPATTGIAFTADHTYDEQNRRTNVTWDNANAQTTPTCAAGGREVILGRSSLAAPIRDSPALPPGAERVSWRHLVCLIHIRLSRLEGPGSARRHCRGRRAEASLPPNDKKGRAPWPG